jgi:hypothetical protein
MAGFSRTVAAAAAAFVIGLVAALPARADTTACRGLWICPQETLRLPESGPAWDALLKRADAPYTVPNLSDRDDSADVETLARALVWARSGSPAYRDQVIAACTQVMGTEAGSTVLGPARGIVSYVIAADIVGLPPDLDRRFRAWLSAVRDRPLAGRTLRGTHRERPNNWGTHAGASRLAIALYLGEAEEVARVARIFRGFLGDRAAYADFRFGALDWQADPAHPVAINPAGARLNGHDVDGVLPDDQRRCCDMFQWPPPGENYVYEALQGALTTAVMLERAGYHNVWAWQDRALLRAFRWMHDVAATPTEGDDEWQTHVINWAYGTDFPAVTPAQPGKAVGYTDWTLSRPFVPLLNPTLGE